MTAVIARSAALPLAFLSFSLSARREAPPSSTRCALPTARRPHRRARSNFGCALGSDSGRSTSSLQHLFAFVFEWRAHSCGAFCCRQLCSCARLARGSSREARGAVARRERGWGNLADGSLGFWQRVGFRVVVVSFLASGASSVIPPQEASELWPTFLASSHGYTLGSRMILHHHHMEGAPRRVFFFAIRRRSREISHFTPLKKRLFVRRRRSECAPGRAAAKFSQKWSHLRCFQRN